MPSSGPGVTHSGAGCLHQALALFLPEGLYQAPGSGSLAREAFGSGSLAREASGAYGFLWMAFSAVARVAPGDGYLEGYWHSRYSSHSLFFRWIVYIARALYIGEVVTSLRHFGVPGQSAVLGRLSNPGRI